MYRQFGGQRKLESETASKEELEFDPNKTDFSVQQLPVTFADAKPMDILSWMYNSVIALFLVCFIMGFYKKTTTNIIAASKSD